MTEMTDTATGGQVAREQDPQVHGHTVINDSPLTERPRRKRGAGFPVVPLPEAAAIMRKSGTFGDDHSQDAFAGYMGHSTANSGSYKRRIASFRDWKLIANATGDRVVFTDLGRRIAYPTDSAKERSDLQEAFENCEIFMKVWDKFAKGVSINTEALANLAVRQLGVAPVSKEQFAESLLESAATAGFATLEGDKVVFVRPGDHDEVPRLPREREGEARELSVRHRVDERVTDERNVGIMTTDHVIPAKNVAIGRNAIATDVRSEPEREREPGRFESMAMEALHRPRKDVALPPEPEVEPAEKPVAVGWRRQQPVREKPGLLHHQAWDIGGGSLTLEIRSSSSLPAEAFMQIGRVMAEVEKLKELLAEGAESGESGE